MAAVLDKKELWVRSDLRLIFGHEDSTLLEEHIQDLQKILSHCQLAKEEQIFNM